LKNGNLRYKTLTKKNKMQNTKVENTRKESQDSFKHNCQDVPWYVDVNKHGRFVRNAKTDIVAQIYADSEEEGDETSTLIALAPALLALVKESLTGMTQTQYRDYKKRANTAVAKAEGRVI
jgi:hypothetical protein